MLIKSPMRGLRLCIRALGTGLRSHFLNAPVGAGWTDLGYVLHINGERIKDIKKGFAAACDRAGITDVTPHTLKHTAATWLIQSGTDPWQAAGFLSTSVQTLLRVYGHHHPDYQRQAAENIGKRPQNVRAIA